MNADTDSTEAQNENELAGLDATDAAQKIHDDIRFALNEVANEYDWGDPEFEAFREALAGETAHGVLGAHIPATTSDDAYLQLGIHLLAESVVVAQRNVGSTDSYRTYVGDARDVLPAIAPLLEKEYIEVQYTGGAIDIMREELAREGGEKE